MEKPKKGMVLVTTRRANYSPNVVHLTNIVLIVEIDEERKVLCIEELIAKVARYDRCLANDIADTFLTKESKMARYLIFYNVKNKEQFVMLKMVQFPAVQVSMNVYITLMSFDLSLLISGVDVTPCFECQELFISNTHEHDIMNNIIQSLANTKVTENLILKKEYSTNLNENLVILFGMSSVEEIVETLTPRMSATKIQRERQINKLSFKRLGGGFVSFQIKGVWWKNEENQIFDDHEACNKYGITLKKLQENEIDAEFKKSVESFIPNNITEIPVLNIL